MFARCPSTWRNRSWLTSSLKPPKVPFTQRIPCRAGPSGPARAIVDHYRCPDTVASFELSGTLGDRPGFFRLGPDTICFGSTSRGSLSAASDGPLHDALDDVAIGCGR